MATKTIAVLDESELEDGQMKEVDFEKGKVLLSRIGDKIYATSAFCTHNGAPLVKGVLTADARLACPWHVACFNVCTGDIEDAPAPSPLHSFQAQVEDGKIYVTADPELTLSENKSRPPNFSTAGFDSVGTGTVIIGGGSGAFYAVESLREQGYKSPITVISKEPYAPINRTRLSKTLITDASKLEWRTPADLKIKYGVNLLLGVEVTSVDLQNKKIIIDNGKDSVAYDKLVISPGANPRRLPIPGADFENVYTFRGLQDSQRVDAAAQEGKRAVVIGTSWIGMELVTVFGKRKLASLDVIGMDECPFEPILGKQIGTSIQKHHESKGVKFHMKSMVEKIVPREDNPSLAAGVVVNGQTLPADFVIMATGVTPATGFLKGSGIELEKDGAIQVDEYLRVVKVPQDVKDVFAIGDVALFPQNGENVRIEHWNVAGNHGRAVGKTIAGNPQSFAKTAVFWSALGQGLRYCGYSVGYDDLIIKGNPDELKFIAYYAKQGKIVAVATMQNDPVVGKTVELIRLGLMPTSEDIKGGKDLLAIDISTAGSLPKVA